MTQPPLTPHRVIAERMKELRKKRGWSAAHLATEMQKLGIAWDRSIIANLELGRRASVTVEELLALAYALGVAPVHLMLPTGRDADFYWFTPEDGTPVVEVTSWLLGQEPIAKQHPGWFAEEKAWFDQLVEADGER